MEKSGLSISQKVGITAYSDSQPTLKNETFEFILSKWGDNWLIDDVRIVV